MKRLAIVILSGLAIGIGCAGLISGSAEHRYRAAFTWPSLIHDYVAGHAVRKLQIGAGANNLQGWLNTDIEPGPGQAYLDATKTFPLASQSFRYVFSEHVIEHLNYDEGLRMLRECHRILSPGGKIRIATPDLLKFIGLFQSERTDAMRAYMEGKAAWHGWAKGPSPSFILNAEMRGAGHQFLYDPATLTSRLSEAGFRDIRQCAPGSSDDAELLGIELRHNIALHPISDYETMVFEASRP